MFVNPDRTPYGASQRNLIGMAHAADARRWLDHCPAHRPTSLLPLPATAAACGVASVHIKAEWDRMGLRSFKALGGSYAVVRHVLAAARAKVGRPVGPEALMSPEVRAVAKTMVFTCASAGNHGLAVAAGARMVGARAVIFLSEAVPESFARRLQEAGAEVRRAGASYEASMAQALAAAADSGWVLLSDSSWAGYTDAPLEIMRGYTVLFEEAAEAMEVDAGSRASHVFVQAGVGGLAASGAGYLRDRWGEAFQLIVVEPIGAACLLESARARRPVRISRRPTALGRLDCAEPSILAFDLLSRLADVFAVITDAEAAAAARRLNAEGALVSACGAAGAAALLALCANTDAARDLRLDATARVLLIGTEARLDDQPGDFE